MGSEIFRPKINKEHKYALAIPFSNGDGKILGVDILQTYPTLEALQVGYEDWAQYAKDRRITRPYKIELLDEELHCQILE